MVPQPTHPPGLQNACSADVDGAVGVFETEQINGGDQWVALCAEFP